MEGPEDDAIMESVVHRMRHSGGGGGDGLNRQFDPQAFQGLLKVGIQSFKQNKNKRKQGCVDFKLDMHGVGTEVVG
jgi:hypothetical protein